MEYVEEGSIAQLLDEFGCLPESICVIYVPQCLMGLDYLHARNVFHRDIKVHAPASAILSLAG